MTKKDYAILACRILAMYLLVQTALLLEGVVVLGYHVMRSAVSGVGAPEWTRNSMICSQGLLLVTQAAAGLLLWVKAPALAGRMVREMAEPDQLPSSPSGIGREGLMEVAFAVLGMLLAVWGLVGLVSYGFYIGTLRRAGSAGYPGYRSLLESLVTFVIGLWLMLGAKGFVSFVGMFRTGVAGRTPGQATPEGGGETPAAPPALSRRIAIAGAVVLALLLILIGVALGGWLRDHVVRVPF